MRKELFLIFAFLFVSELAFSQEDKTKASVVDSLKNIDDIDTIQNMIDIVRMTEGQMEQDFDENSASNHRSSLLRFSSDIYTKNTSYPFRIANFKDRGLDNRYEDISINGFLMNNPMAGNSISQWDGLSSVIINPEIITGIEPADFIFGHIGGATNYTVRASSYRKQIRASYALTNRSSCNNRLAITAVTGLLSHGWAFAASVSARFGDVLSYVDGCSSTGYGYFLTAEKQFNQQHALTLAVFGTPTSRGMQGGVASDVFDILGNHNYNPNWGWYQGKKRNARVYSSHEPVALLTHYYSSENNKVAIVSTLASTFGRSSNTALNWHNAPDPRPDYYRNLPDLQDTNYTHIYNEWLNNANVRQINWNNMYALNQMATQQGNQAHYIVEKRITDHIQVGGSSNIVILFSDHIKLSAGVDIRGMKQHNYKIISNLLNGSYWLDTDKYPEGEFPNDPDVLYNNLDAKNQPLYERDIFGYNYNFYTYKQEIWATLQFKFNTIDFHIGGNIGGTEYWREGKMRNGRFPTTSIGKSELKSFLDAAAKAGIVCKINKNHHLQLNGMFTGNAPDIRNIFVAAHINNAYINSLKTEKSLSSELSYIMKYPKVLLRLTGYFIQMKDITRQISFYHGDLSSMVNYSMTGIDQRHLGIEGGIEVKIGSMFAIAFAGNYGDYRYINRPHLSIFAENGYIISQQEQTVDWKNYHVAGTPQAAITLGVKFNRNNWFANINANYFDKIYFDMNPLRRSAETRGTLNENSKQYHLIVDQTFMKGKFMDKFTLDASVGKSWKIKHYTIGFHANVTNILNNKNLITSAWEQYPFDYSNLNVDKLQNKYHYTLGTIFYVGLNFMFN